MKLLSRSGIPDEIKVVPLGPDFSPGVCADGTADMLREKLLNRGLVAAIAAASMIKIA